jgi:hypothetical protein
MASENEVRLQLKGGRSIKIIRTETPTGGMWSIPEMPEIAAHQNISVIRDRLRGKGLIASRPGEKDMMAEDKYGFVSYGLAIESDKGLRYNAGGFRTREAAEKNIKDEIRKYVGEHGLRAEIWGNLPNWAGEKIVKTLRFSRPGAKATFKVEDRFYFGKGRKERFDRYGYEKMNYDRLVRESYHLKDSAEYAASLGRKDNELRQKMSALQKEFTRRGFTAAATVLDAALRKPFSRPGQPERFWARGYDDAKDRVRRSPELGKYAKIIMQPEFDTADHWEWVSRASTSEIVNWAKSISRDM